jgi:hypothetical protein
LEGARETFERLGQQDLNLVPVFRNLATIARREGRPRDETQLLQCAIDALERLGDTETRLAVLHRLAAVLSDLNRPRGDLAQTVSHETATPSPEIAARTQEWKLTPKRRSVWRMLFRLAGRPGRRQTD